MSKRTMLYASPFWPQKSGISQYSASLLEGLREYFDITLLSDGYRIEDAFLRDNFRVLNDESSGDYSRFDVVLCNIGNNYDFHGYIYDLILKMPCHVILHDESLYYLTVGRYRKTGQEFSKIYELEGVSGISLVKDSLRSNPNTDLLEHKNLAHRLLLNGEIIRSAKSLIVHSQYLMNNLEKIKPDAKLMRIDLVNSVPKEQNDPGFLRKRFHLAKDDFILGAFGYIAPTKQNDLTCAAINEYNENHNKKIHYIMCGEGEYADGFLNKNIHKTSFLSNSEFFSSIADCNLIANLRYPYNGETSATLIQAMGLGIPCIVTDIGWFGEVPDDCVIKVDPDIRPKELGEKLGQLAAQDLTGLSAAASKYVAERCSPGHVAGELSRFL